jgi:hypothetical protein
LIIADTEVKIRNPRESGRTLQNSNQNAAVNYVEI